MDPLPRLEGNLPAGVQATFPSRCWLLNDAHSQGPGQGRKQPQATRSIQSPESLRNHWSLFSTCPFDLNNYFFLSLSFFIFLAVMCPVVDFFFLNPAWDSLTLDSEDSCLSSILENFYPLSLQK